MIYLSDNDIIQTLTASAPNKRLLVRLHVEDLHYGTYAVIAEVVRLTNAASETKLNLKDVLGRYLRSNAAEDLPGWKTAIAANYRYAVRRWYLSWAELDAAGLPGTFTIGMTHTVVLGGLPKRLESKITDPIATYLQANGKWLTWAPVGTLSRTAFDHLYLPLYVPQTGTYEVRLILRLAGVTVDTLTQNINLTADRYVRLPVKDADLYAQDWDQITIQVYDPEPGLMATRTYRRRTEPLRPLTRVLYRNSLGYYDLAEFSGDAEETLSHERETVERGGWELTATKGEAYVWQTEGQTAGVLRTGYLSKEEYLHLSELAASEEVYLIDEATEQYLPIVLTNKNLPRPASFQRVYAWETGYRYLFTSHKHAAWN